MPRTLGNRAARRILETACDLGYEVAIRRLLGLEMKPIIEVAVKKACSKPWAGRMPTSENGIATMMTSGVTNDWNQPTIRPSTSADAVCAATSTASSARASASSRASSSGYSVPQRITK